MVPHNSQSGSASKPKRIGHGWSFSKLTARPASYLVMVIHDSRAAIMAYLAESGQLTAGTLRAGPQVLMADGEGHVSVLVRLSATRPDGRAMDGPQLVLFTVDDGRVRSIEQFVGDPAAVTAFWA